MGYTAKGEPVCDSCHTSFPGTITEAVFLGWGHWEGQNNGGSQAEHVICRNCRTQGHRRPPKPVKGFEDEPLF